MARRAKPVAERLQDRITVTDQGCWEFDGIGSDGYGQIWTGSKVDGTMRLRKAHIVSYEVHVGPVPAGLELDHLCRNRGCCNPAHLEPVTHRENMRRSPIHPSVVQAARTHCPQGHAYNEQNTYRDRHGKRYCNTCRSLRDQKGAWKR